MRTIIALAAVLLLSACTSGSMQNARSSSLRPTAYEIDHQKVAIANRQARERGAEIVWVSMPKRRIAGEQRD